MSKLTFDRKEYETGLGDAFKAFGGMIKTIFSKQKDNDMLNDLNIRKGFLAGLRYLLYLGFVLPFKMIGWIMTPKWAWVHFVQRHLVSPLFEVDAISGEESPSKIMGTMYEKYINHIKASTDAGMEHNTIKPEISSLERIVIFAKIRVVITMFIFIFGAVSIYEMFNMIIVETGIFSALMGALSYFSVGDMDGLGGFVGLGVMGVAGYMPIVILGAYIAYIMIFALRFIVESAKSLMYVDRLMLTDFVDDSLHYTITKSIDMYGQDIAIDAYGLLLSNIVVEQNRYVKDEPFYKLLKEEITLKEDMPVIDES